MKADYYAEQATRCYAMADEIRTEDPRDPFGNGKNTAVTYLRLAGAKLRDVAEASAEAERNAKPEVTS